MNGDNSVKTTIIGFKATEGEKARIKAMADAFTGGDTSALLRQLVLATETALGEHGRDHTIWPPQLNHFPPNTQTRQDLDSGLNLEKGTD